MQKNKFTWSIIASLALTQISWAAQTVASVTSTTAKVSFAKLFGGTATCDDAFSGLTTFNVGTSGSSLRVACSKLSGGKQYVALYLGIPKSMNKSKELDFGTTGTAPEARCEALASLVGKASASSDVRYDLHWSTSCKKVKVSGKTRYALEISAKINSGSHYSPPSSQPIALGNWHCVATSSRNFNYAWDASNKTDAQNGAADTCDQYEVRNGAGGFCYTPTCSYSSYGRNDGWNSGSAYHCSVSSSRGYNYTWDAADSYSAASGAENTCYQYEVQTGLGYCNTASCSLQYGGGDGGYNFNQQWECHVSSNRGYDYVWDASDRNSAEQGAQNTCYQYEVQSGLGYCSPSADCQQIR